jgi:hypothetical protein
VNLAVAIDLNKTQVARRGTSRATRWRWFDVAPLMVIVIVMMIVAVVAVIVMMVIAIVGNVSAGVPVMPNEVDRLAAGIVLAAMVAPIALISRANVQINRWRQHAAMNAYAHDGRAIDEAGRGRVAEIHASVEAGIAQADGGRHLCERCTADCQRCNTQREK